MADMREALRKAGLVSSKQARQSQHQERVERKQLGHDGLEDERRQRAEAATREREEKRAHDQQVERDRLEQERRDRLESARRQLDVGGMIAAGLVPGATAGSRQYFFTLPTGQITCLELSDGAIRSLQSGTAAIVESLGAVPSPYCVVTAATAHAVRAQRPEVILEMAEPSADRPRR